MTTLADVTASELIKPDSHYELIYLIATLIVATLSALVASFLEFRRRQRHDTSLTSPIDCAGSWPICMRQDTFRLQTHRKCSRHDRSPTSKDRILLLQIPAAVCQLSANNFSTRPTKIAVLLVIDDLMNETDQSISDLFTKGSHHRNASVVLMMQNLFYKNKHVRTISLNAHYIFFFKTPRYLSQLESLACQIYPINSIFAINAYLCKKTVQFI